MFANWIRMLALCAACVAATLAPIACFFYWVQYSDRKAAPRRAQQEAAREARCAAVRATQEYTNLLNQTMADKVTIVSGTVVSILPSNDPVDPEFPSVKVLVRPISIRYARQLEDLSKDTIAYFTGRGLPLSPLVLIDKNCEDPPHTCTPGNSYTFYSDVPLFADAYDIAGQPYVIRTVGATSLEMISMGVVGRILAAQEKTLRDQKTNIPER